MYIKVSEDKTEFPYVLENIRTENPNTSFPFDLERIMESYGVYKVEPPDFPVHNNLTHYVEQDSPIKIQDGKYKQAWKLIARYTPQEEARVLLANAKQEKLNQIQGEYSLAEKDGWNSGQGFSLGTSPNDIALLAGVFALAKEASALGMPIPSIISLENKQIDFNNIQEMTSLMLQYGAARAQVSKDFAARRRAVEAARTVEEVQAI